jgi:hypothetical protein
MRCLTTRKPGRRCREARKRSRHHRPSPARRRSGAGPLGEPTPPGARWDRPVPCGRRRPERLRGRGTGRRTGVVGRVGSWGRSRRSLRYARLVIGQSTGILRPNPFHYERPGPGEAIRLHGIACSIERIRTIDPAASRFSALVLSRLRWPRRSPERRRQGRALCVCVRPWRGVRSASSGSATRTWCSRPSRKSTLRRGVFYFYHASGPTVIEPLIRFAIERPSSGESPGRSRAAAQLGEVCGHQAHGPGHRSRDLHQRPWHRRPSDLRRPDGFGGAPIGGQPSHAKQDSRLVLGSVPGVGPGR